MSHYSVLVVSDRPVDEVLYPYWELDLPIDKLLTDPRSKFEVEIPEGIGMSGMSKLQEEFQSYLISRCVNPSKYKSAEAWAEKDYHGYYHLAGAGWGYFGNPKAKWDCYSVGGRWSGMLILKKGRLGINGERSRFNPGKNDEGTCDIATVGNVDWKAMHAKAQERAAKDWDDLFNDNIGDKCWYNPSYVQRQREKHLELYGTKEEYLKRRGIWTTYALVDDKEWFAPGEMGWFGMSSDDTEDRDIFDQKFLEYMKSLDKDKVITVVDCHI